MTKFLLKVIYFLTAVIAIAIVINISFLRESGRFDLTLEMLIVGFAALFAFYAVGSWLWSDDADHPKYFYPLRPSHLDQDTRWLEEKEQEQVEHWSRLEQQAQADIDAGRVYRYKNMDEAIRNLGNDKDD